MKKILGFTFFTTAFLGALKILSIVPFDRMSADDFTFTTVAVNKGLLAAQKQWYVSITGRFTANFLQSVFGMISSANGRISIYFLLTFLLAFGAFYYFFKNLLKSKVKKLYIAVLAMALLSAYYLITPNKNESWYWLTGSVTYLWPTILGLYAIAILLSNKLSKAKYVLAFLLSFVAVGADETYGFLVSVFLFFFLLILFFREYLDNKGIAIMRVKKLLFKTPLFKRVFAVFLGSALSFAIVFVAPGNAKRISGPGANEMSWFGAILYSIQTGPMLIYEIYRNNALFLTSIVFAFASFFSIHNVFSVQKLPDTKNLLNKLFFSVAIPVFLSIVFILPGYRALGRIAPSRTEVILAFVVLMSSMVFSYYLGQLITITNINKKLYFKYLVLGVCVLLFAASFKITSTLGSDVYIAKDYSVAFDTMFNTLSAESKRDLNQTVVIPQLPDSGLVHSEKLRPDPNHWANKPISNFFGLKGITIPVEEKE